MRVAWKTWPAVPLASSVHVPSIEWAKGYSFAPSESHPHGGVQTRDGGFLMVGDGVNYQDTRTVKRHWFAQKVDKRGNMEWQAKFGDTGYNYGKFGIELPDSTFVLAGALSKESVHGTVLHRTLLRLDANGTLMQQLVLENDQPHVHHQDGFMCVALADDPAHSFVATGFVNGENSTTGYVDEPMFLIKGGNAFVTKISYTATTMSVAYEKVIDDSKLGFRIYQGMRMVYDPKKQLYLASHTISYDNGGNIEMGMTALGLDGTVKWTKGFRAGSAHGGHASHPYALALNGAGDGYVIGGLAVIMDAKQIEQCQGRMIHVSPTGDLVWDSRFTSEQKDTNIECYGVQATQDGGYIMTCGTGVEPELHPSDSQKLKTWMVLVIRVDAKGNKLTAPTEEEPVLSLPSFLGGHAGLNAVFTLLLLEL